MRRITVLGVGYVGLVTGACFADLGNQVICLDVIPEKIEKLKRGELPIYEPGLEEMVQRNAAAGRLTFTTEYAEAISNAEFIFVAVGTPSGVDGEADLKYIRSAVENIAAHLKSYAIIVNRSTVPVGTGDSTAQTLIERGKKQGVDFQVVSNPEFTREGSAVYDFLNPDRVVLGSVDLHAAEAVADLYRVFTKNLMLTDLRTAEMIKYASNAFLAMKISFINEIASICEKLGADVKLVAQGMGMDARIGAAFLNAGLGYGGSCFPKDVKALTYMAEVNGLHPQLLRAVMDINRDQRRRVILHLRELLGNLRGKTIGLLGLAFKPNTDDIREAAAIDLAHMLSNEGANLRAYDPVAMDNAHQILDGVKFCNDAYQVAAGADAVVLVTEWNEFRQLDMPRLYASMARKIFLDGRNIYDPAEMRAHGFEYRGVGRPLNDAPHEALQLNDAAVAIT
ncbi:UDP-glucose/GDP-mannose dehydrogenase family protein [Anaerolineae bacterium CFX7]|nr:UDP-glucose/GDP-mannose dehydrogenase family protein [Anaerolineae bacterium CFX7]